MEVSSTSSKQSEESNFNLKECAIRARRMSQEKSTNSRRFSASNLKSFREETRSFRSNIIVSSTSSSPGYTVREEIDPSTYSFTTALRALQAKTVYTWELQTSNGFSLNSKWNEAEKYISNPLSGEVPLECLSAKTLSGRSFRRITISAPLIYPSQMQHFDANTPPVHEHEPQITSNEKTKTGKTRDIGTQSTPVDLSSSSPTPSIEERLMKMADSSSSLKPDTEEEVMKETRDVEREGIKRNGGERKRQETMMSRGGCLSLRGLWMRTQSSKHREKHKHPTTNTKLLSTLLHQFNACSKD